MNSAPGPSSDPPAAEPVLAAARRRISLSGALMLTFGSLVFLAVATVLGLGFWSARQNTISLTRDLATAMLNDLEHAVSAHLLPAQRALDHLGPRIERGEIDIADDDQIFAALAAATASMPQLGAILLVRPDGQALRVLRTPAGVELGRQDINAEPSVRGGLEEAARHNGSYWAELVQPLGMTITLLNVRRPVVIQDRFAGVLVASVRVARLSDLVVEVGKNAGGEAFILYDDRFVLAHRSLRDGYGGATPAKPLPGADELGDPVLAAFLGGTTQRMPGGFMAKQAGIQLVRTPDDKIWPTMSRRLALFGERPWVIGVYFDNDVASTEFRRLVAAGLAGIGVLIISLFLAWRLSRYIARPLHGFAFAARQVRDFELDDLAVLPPSRIREISEAGSAFNAMVRSLRWFELYVPRALVQRMLRHGDDGLTVSARRPVTVLFTDIAGFTGLSETLTAEETAALLNGHFAMLGDCVEAEGGTIDKYIGDALMAFWGAPVEQPDHAERACRAALAIRSALDAANAARRSAGLPSLRLRVGLHSGEALVGNIGAPGRINYTIVGDTVNIANRLEHLGHDHVNMSSTVTILLSQMTRGQAPSAADATPIGSQHLNGRREEIDVFAL